LAGLELALAPEANAETGDKSKPGKEQPKRIVLPSWATGNKAEAWDDYFRRNEATHAAVRETVRALMAEKKYDDVIGVVEGALRQKQSQPWMYEALGIALQLSGRPAAEIERVMMSAVDFGNGTGDLVRVAYYLSHWMPDDRDLAKRALQLYRQATEQTPNEAEIYTHSLALAQRWNDLDALEWSLAGILRFPWPHSQRHIPENAQQIADTTVKSLVDKMDVNRAASFKRTIDAARIRDCVIRVSWIGTADIDLLVEDPSGSICTYSQPRSAGGGVLLRDSQAAGADTRDETTKFEEYVCTEGLNGRYRMQVRRIWGKVNGDKVSIDFWTQRGTPNEVRQRQVLELKDGELVANFDVAGARRTSIDIDPKLATTVNYQLAIGKSILAQQLGGPQSLTTRADQLPVSTISPRNFSGAQAGYRPLIISLPTGANMQATAVVSNDRRYVRITAQPVFSSIPTVNVYNFGTGGQYTYALNAPNSGGGGPPNSPGTAGTCAASANTRNCAATPPVTGYVALLHPNNFLANGGCATIANPFVDEAGDFVTPAWTPTPRTPPTPTIAPDSVLLGTLNGLPAISIPAGRVLRTKVEQSNPFTGVHVFMLGSPPSTLPTPNGPSWDLLVDYSNEVTNAGLPTRKTVDVGNNYLGGAFGRNAISGGFMIFLDQRPRAGVANGFYMTEHNGSVRPVNSLMMAVGLRSPLSIPPAVVPSSPPFYFGRTNSQDGAVIGYQAIDGDGATRAMNQMDMFDFGFRHWFNPNGGAVSGANVGPAFRHVPLPLTYDPLLDNAPWENWGVYDNSFSYRFYKSNAAWESYPRPNTGIKTIPDPPGATPTSITLPDLVRLWHPNTRDTTVALLNPDPMQPMSPSATVEGKPRTGLNGYWPQNERNVTPPVPTGPINVPPDGNLGYSNLYDEWFPIPRPTQPPNLSDTVDLPTRNTTTYLTAAGVTSAQANVPPLVAPPAGYNPLQDSGPGFARNRFRRIALGGAVDMNGDLLPEYTNRQDDLRLSIVVIYPRILTFDEANQVATWINCWGGAVNYDRSADPRTAIITDDRRNSKLQNWPYTIP
jgi:hypothetical protein